MISPFKVRDIVYHTIKDQNTHIAISPLKKSSFFELVKLVKQLN